MSIVIRRQPTCLHCQNSIGIVNLHQQGTRLISATCGLCGLPLDNRESELTIAAQAENVFQLLTSCHALRVDPVHPFINSKERMIAADLCDQGDVNEKVVNGVMLINTAAGLKCTLDWYSYQDDEMPLSFAADIENDIARHKMASLAEFPYAVRRTTQDVVANGFHITELNKRGVQIRMRRVIATPSSVSKISGYVVRVELTARRVPS